MIWADHKRRKLRFSRVRRQYSEMLTLVVSMTVVFADYQNGKRVVALRHASLTCKGAKAQCSTERVSVINDEGADIYVAKRYYLRWGR